MLFHNYYFLSSCDFSISSFLAPVHLNIGLGLPQCTVMMLCNFTVPLQFAYSALKNIFQRLKDLFITQAYCISQKTANKNNLCGQFVDS